MRHTPQVLENLCAHAEGPQHHGLGVQRSLRSRVGQAGAQLQHHPQQLPAACSACSAEARS